MMRLIAALAGCLSILFTAGASAGCDAVHSVIEEAHRPVYGEPSPATYTAGTFEVVVVDRTEKVAGASVSPDFFTEAKASPLLGRGFAVFEHAPPEVVMLSHAFWTSRFGADRSIIGRTLRVGGRDLTVVGIMPKGFTAPRDAMLWVPR
jgi:hypothetical protein